MDGWVDGWMKIRHANVHTHTHTHTHKEISVTHRASAAKPDVLCGEKKAVLGLTSAGNRDAPKRQANIQSF